MAKQGYIGRATGQPLFTTGLGVDPTRRFDRIKEQYFFDYVTEQLIDKYGANTVRAGGLEVHTTIDLDKQRAARAAIDRQPRRGRALGGDRHNRGEQRQRPGDGLERRLRGPQVQPRRPGSAPARLGLQDDGADRGRCARASTPTRPTTRRRARW